MLKNAKPYTERLFDFRTIAGLARATSAALSPSPPHVSAHDLSATRSS
jgi:hypothetical protein